MYEPVARSSAPPLVEGRFPLGAAVAADRRAALAECRPLPAHARGAVMVADVTGFSSLASRLVRERGEGDACDALTLALNSQLGRLIDAVHRHQGVVVGFAGDALRAWFPPLAGDRADAGPALRLVGAWRTCLAPANAPDPEPAMRLGFGAAFGPVHRLTVGDPAVRLFDAITGPVVRAAERAQRGAAPGRLILDRSAGRVLEPWVAGVPCSADGSLVVTRWTLPPFAVEAPPDLHPPEHLLAQWLDARIRRQLLTLGSVPAEIRLVRPVFVGYRLLDRDPAAGAGHLSGLTAWIQSVIHGLGGCVMHVLPSGPRGYVAAVFGAPTAYRDDGDRAAQAARLLCRPPAELAWALTTSVGASEGRAWTGLCGSPKRFAYTVVGDAANIAARLMAVAEPGRALITADLARSARRHRFGEAAELQLKGQPEPVTVRPLIGRHPGRRQAWTVLPLAGRDHELGQLLADLDRPGARTVIRGAAGLGKSRLANELQALAEARGLRTVRLFSDAIQGADPLYPWPQAVVELLGLGDDATQEAIVRAAGRIPGVDPRAPLFRSLLHLGHDDDEHTRFMDGETRLGRISQLMTTILCGVPRRPRLLIVEDVHWLSPSAAAVLEQLWTRLPHVVMVATTRPGAGAPLRALPGTGLIDLPPLDEGAALALMRAAAGGRHIGPAVARFVQERANGHPFFTLELVAGLRQAGLLSAGAPEPTPARLDALEAPHSVEAAIASRLDELPPQHRRVLRIASVLGGPMDTRAVCALLPDLSRPEVRRALVALRSRDLLSGGPAEYRFGHELTRRVVYHRIPARERVQLHHRVARFYRQQANVPDAVMARHLDRAERPDEAIPHLERAARHALRHGAFAECAGFLERARQLAEVRAVAVERLADWDWSASQALYRLGRLGDALRAAEAAAAHFDRPVPETAWQLTRHVTTQATRQLWHRVRGLPQRPRVLGSTWVVRAASVHQQLSELYFLTGDLSRSALAALRQLNLAERAGPTVGLAQAYGSACILSGMMGLHGLARTYAALGKRAASRVPDPSARAVILHEVSLYHSGIGEFGSVARDEDEAMLIYARLGDRGRLRDSLTIAGLAAWLSGDLPRTRALLSRLDHERDLGESFLQEVWATVFLAGLDLREGRPDRAVEGLRGALDRLAHEPIEMADLACRGLLAEALWQTGHRDGALAFVASILRTLADTPTRPAGYPALDGYWAAMHLSRLAAKSTTRRAERLHWEAQAADATRHLQAFHRTYPIGGPRALLAQGLLLLDGGRTRDARECLNAATHEALRMSMRWDLAEVSRITGAPC